MPQSKHRVFVIGVGMTKFEKPGRRDDFDYPAMAREAVTKALLDAGLRYSSVQSAYCGYVYGDSTCGQRALYQFGQTGIPIVNVNNNCSTGSTALYLAREKIESGAADCVLALGFEKMNPGSLKSAFDDRTNPLDWNVALVAETGGFESGAPFAAQIFANAGTEYCDKYGAKGRHMAMIAEKSHRHSTMNPYAQFQKEYTLAEIEAAPHVAGALTKLMCSPTSDGAACAIVASESFVKRHGLEDQAVEILAQALTTDTVDTMEHPTPMRLAGADMTRAAARHIWDSTSVTPREIDVVELHDCFAANELITYPALGLCRENEAHLCVERGEFTHGGSKCLVNPSGGLISKGHPLGATGLAQCAELVWQLRGWCGKRQRKGCKYALQHNIGLGGACVVTLYARMKSNAQNEGGATKALGYNPAVECRTVSDDQVANVCALHASDFLRAKM